MNRGSSEPLRMVGPRYRPAGDAIGRLALVGKGVTYDSGGLSLKAGDAVHGTMKTDMSGAAPSSPRWRRCRHSIAGARFTGYLMCTDKHAVRHGAQPRGHSRSAVGRR